jgi:peptidoglycan/LPS O-acetylase OafA/YrhL
VRISPSSGRRLAGIEGLRAIAAGSILVYHVWVDSSPDGTTVRLGPLTSFMPDLAFGVTLFFVLSGFLLYRPFASSILDEGVRPSLRKYFQNRALRILPAYWVVLLLVGLVLQSAFVRGAAHGLHHGALVDPETLFANVLFLQNYRPRTLLTGIGPTWSLAVEVVFYVTLPFLALTAWSFGRRAASRLGRRISALAPVLALLIIGLTGKAVAAFIVTGGSGPYAGFMADWHSVVERSFWCQADLFAFGMALAVLKVEVDAGRVRIRGSYRVAAAISALLAYLVTARETTQFNDRLGHSLFSTLMAFAFALVVGLVVLPGNRGHRPLRLVGILESRPLVAAGAASYSVFLWHQPIVFWLHDHGVAWGGRAGFAANLTLTAVVTGILAALTWRYVEKPALGLKAKTREQPKHAVPVEQLEAAP